MTRKKKYITATCPMCNSPYTMIEENVKKRNTNFCRRCVKRKTLSDLIGKTINDVHILGFGADRIRSDGSHTAIFLCRCVCGKEFSALATSVKNGHTKSCGCYKIKVRSFSWSGSNNPQFANLSEEERASADNIRKLPEYEKWRQDVISRDFGECQKCGSDLFIEVHHIRSYKQNPGLAVNIDNGIVLCSTCHREYHSFNGGTRKEATIESFNEWFRRK